MENVCSDSNSGSLQGFETDLQGFYKVRLDCINKLVLGDSTILKNNSGVLKYGTAGFRANWSKLTNACFRVGIIVGLRVKATGRAGVMITASHNPPNDNGVKIIERDGSMLVQSWEPLAEHIVNSEDLLSTLLAFDLKDYSAKYGFEDSIFSEPVAGPEGEPVAIFGMDTRESSPTLLKYAIAGCNATGVKHVDFGLCTTPQLHWNVANGITNAANKHLYSKQMVDAFLAFASLIPEADLDSKQQFNDTLTVDCANGVSAVTLQDIINHSDLKKILKIDLINSNNNP